MLIENTITLNDLKGTSSKTIVASGKTDKGENKTLTCEVFYFNGAVFYQVAIVGNPNTLDYRDPADAVRNYNNF